MFSLGGLRLYFPVLEPWVAQSVSLPCHSSRFIYVRMWATGSAGGSTACPVCSTIHHPARSSSCRPATSPLCPGCPSQSLLPVWMNVSSLSPWLSDFCTVRFSVSFGCFLFLNCCYPSFGCARRRSVSIYASVLAGSSEVTFLEGSNIE